jgi:membrane protease YdiL (CAAX protease family)
MGSQANATAKQSGLLKSFWTTLIGPPWVVALTLYVFVGIVRAIALLSPYALQELFFLQSVLLWALPFIFLTEQGRHEIGLTGETLRVKAALLSLLAGAGGGLAIFTVGMLMYGASPENWCVSIRNYLHFDEVRGIMTPLEIFALYSLPAVCLNPIGEEILFRGFTQQAFGRRFGRVTGTVVSAVMFGSLYLCIHGLSMDQSGVHMRRSAGVAFVLMALIGALFTVCRFRSRSPWAAMVAHAGFNLALLGATVFEFVR